jgi:hypothetical protein
MKMVNKNVASMDSLLHALNTFSISKTKTEQDFDDIIDGIIACDLKDPDSEWIAIVSNYSKLRYLDHLIDFFEFPETDKFKSILNTVLDDVDKKNQYYLSELNWGEEELQLEFDEIQNLFLKSLNEHNPFTKIKYILEGYAIFIPIIEDFRSEEFKDILDTRFLTTVDSLTKKRKYRE